jgi:hypothetical protein
MVFIDHSQFFMLLAPDRPFYIHKIIVSLLLTPRKLAHPCQVFDVFHSLLFVFLAHDILVEPMKGKRSLFPAFRGIAQLFKTIHHILRAVKFAVHRFWVSLLGIESSRFFFFFTCGTLYAIDIHHSLLFMVQTKKTSLSLFGIIGGLFRTPWCNAHVGLVGREPSLG